MQRASRSLRRTWPHGWTSLTTCPPTVRPLCGRTAKTTGRAKWSCLQAPFAGWHFRPCQRLAVPADPGDGAELLSLSIKGTSAGLLSCTPRCLRTGTLESPGTKVPGHLFISVSAPAGSAGGSAAGTRFRTGKSAPPWRQGWPAPDGTESCPPTGSPAAPPAAGHPGLRPFLAP